MIPRRKFNGAKHSTEATDVRCQGTGIRLQASGNRKQERISFLVPETCLLCPEFCPLSPDMVGEHCGRLRRYTVRSAGGSTRAYVDTSSEKQGEKPCRRKPKVSCSQVNLLRVSRLLRRGREA